MRNIATSKLLKPEARLAIGGGYLYRREEVEKYLKGRLTRTSPLLE